MNIDGKDSVFYVQATVSIHHLPIEAMACELSLQAVLKWSSTAFCWGLRYLLWWTNHKLNDHNIISEHYNSIVQIL